VSEHSEAVNNEPVTLINVFEVPAEHVNAFADQWRERAKIMSAAPGFRDSRLHQAISAQARFQFINVAHWDSHEAWEAAASNPQFQARIRALDSAVLVGANPALYRPVVEFGP
jgi:heme-degrading monooxygenase HmoA